MSWLSRSLANSLRLDDPPNDVVSASDHPPNRHDDSMESDSSRGVKDDLSEFGQTLTRQFWGVASFLAPPPQEQAPNPDSDPVSGDDGGDEVVRERGEEEDAVERFEEEEAWERNEESDCLDDEFDYYDGDGDGDGPAVVGITHEVLAFARNIAMHPETWLDFPLDEEEDPDDFDMSEAQQDHAFAIEQFSPRLAALRIELCPCHMSLGYFWKVYFVLLHSRLNKHDAEVLSTPQVMEARAKWMHELHEQTKPDPDCSARSISNFRDESNSPEEDDYCPSENNLPFWSFSSEPNVSYASTDYETEKHPVESTETPLIDKSVIEEEQVSKTKDMYPLVGSSSKVPVPDFEDEDDRWLEDEDLELQGYGTTIAMGNEDDISFSDLENDDLSLPKKTNIIAQDCGASLKKS